MQAKSEVLELRLDGGVISRPPGLEIFPGQYLLASRPGDALPRALFPGGLEPEQITVAGALPAAWQVGQSLRLRGPLGTGFQLPETARRVAAAGLDENPARLLPLIDRALEQGAEVCLYTASLPAGLPEAVEVLSPDLLPEAWGWADFLALDCPQRLLGNLPGLLPKPRPYTLPCPAQVLVYTHMSCGGLAECAICAVETLHGWKHACKDGPVFDLKELLG